jgi:uncharacterized membrane protein
MKNRKVEIILAAVIALLPMIAGVILYDRLPEQIATHFGMNGEANGWSSRAFTVFGLPAMMAGLALLGGFSLSTDPKRQNMNPVLRSIGIWTAPAVSILVSAFILANALGYESRIELIWPVLTGLLFIIIGNFLPKTKQSYTMGIRLPWTLNSEENWNRTHRLAGFLWVLGGAYFIVMSFVGWSLGAFLVPLLVMTLIPAVYSYALYKKGI